MIEIYEIIPVSGSVLVPESRRFTAGLEEVLGSCREVGEWEPPGFRLLEPTGSDFVGTLAGTFAIAGRLAANHRLTECLEHSGELLPVETADGQRFELFSPIGCVNSLNGTESVFADSTDTREGDRIILKYVLHAGRIPCAPVFRIPETRRTRLYLSRNARLHCPDDFMTVYNRENFTGLRFEKVWEGTGGR